MSGPLDPPEDTERLGVARTATDEATQMKLVRAAVTESDGKLAGELARNPALSVAAVDPLVPLLEFSDIKEMVSLHASRPEVVEAVLAHRKVHLTDELLEETGRPEAALLAAVKARTAAARASGDLPLFPFQLYRSEHWSDRATMALPLASFNGHWVPRSHGRTLTSALSTAFGDDTSAWETFEALSTDGRPVGELIDAVLLLLDTDVDADPTGDTASADGAVSVEDQATTADPSGQLVLQV